MLRFRDDGLDWYIRGIFNKLGRAEFTIYFYDLGFALKDVPWDVYDPVSQTVITPPERLERSYSFFGGWQERTLVVDRGTDNKAPASPLLTPSEDLRAAVKAEFDEKVEERLPFFNFLGLGSEADPALRKEGRYWNSRNYPDCEEYYRNYIDERGRDYHGDPRFLDEHGNHKAPGAAGGQKQRGWLWRLLFGQPKGKDENVCQVKRKDK